eukprot:2724634-Rhodomonas_salina.5
MLFKSSRSRTLSAVPGGTCPVDVQEERYANFGTAYRIRYTAIRMRLQLYNKLYALLWLGPFVRASVLLGVCRSIFGEHATVTVPSHGTNSDVSGDPAQTVRSVEIAVFAWQHCKRRTIRYCILRVSNGFGNS